MRLVLFAVLFSMFAVSGSARAQDYKTILDLPAGQTLLNLSVNERVEVEQDEMVALLRFEAEHKDPRELQDRINEVMKQAVEQAKSYENIQVSTQQYYVYPHDFDPDPPQPYNRNEPPRKLERVWRGQQGLQLKSKNADDLLKLTGELQALGLTMNSLNYALSQDLLESTRDSLLEAALEKLMAKAERAARALGKSEAALLEVNVDTGGYYPQPVMRTMAMSAEASTVQMDAPVAAPGQSDITLSVSAKALLK